MTLEDYLSALQHLVKTNPKIKKLPVVYSVDDEGNRFQQVNFTPCVGEWDDSEFEAKSENPNAVCIN